MVGVGESIGVIVGETFGPKWTPPEKPAVSVEGELVGVGESIGVIVGENFTRVMVSLGSLSGEI